MRDLFSTLIIVYWKHRFIIMIFDTGCFNMTVELSNAEDMMKVYKVYHMFSQIYRPPTTTPMATPVT